MECQGYDFFFALESQQYQVALAIHLTTEQTQVAWISLSNCDSNKLYIMVFEKLRESNQLIDLSRALHAAAERNEILPMHQKASKVA